MSYISVQAKVNAASQRLGSKCGKSKKASKIDRTETSFGGKGCLTKEQYEKGMALSQKMQHMSAW